MYIYIYIHTLCVCVTLCVLRFAKLPLAKNANHLGLCSPVGNKRNLSPLSRTRVSKVPGHFPEQGQETTPPVIGVHSHNKFSGCEDISLDPSLDPSKILGSSC